MTRTVGEMLRRYLHVRDLLQEEDDRELKREESDLKGRLVTNYSPLVKYVAGRVSARSLEPVDREDLLSWGIVGPGVPEGTLNARPEDAAQSCRE